MRLGLAALLGTIVAGALGAGVALALSGPPPRTVSPAAAAHSARNVPAYGQPRPAQAVQPARNEAFVIKRILPISGPIKYGEWHWNEAGAPAGPIVVTVDLDARVMSVFRAGYEIGAAAVLLGTEDKPTPLGVFPITEKKRSHTSNLYDAPMPYMQRLTDDGITLHATDVAWGYASHGCVGMPEEFAKKVFETTQVGDQVYITRGKTASLGDSLTGS